MFIIYRGYNDGSDTITEQGDSIDLIFGACASYVMDPALTDLVVFNKTTGAVIINYHVPKGS